jgi:acyl carrier protein
MENFVVNLVDLLDEKPGVNVDENTVFKDLPGWDSLVSLSLIVMVSDDYGKSIDGGTIRSCNTIRELYEAVNG